MKTRTARKKRSKVFCCKKPIHIVDTTLESSVNDISSESCQVEDEQHHQIPTTSYIDDDITLLPSTSKTTISSKKVHSITSSSINEVETVCGYRFIDLEILNNVFQLLCCPTCHGALQLFENSEKKKGLASFLSVKCHCGFSHDFYTSTSSSHQSFDINKRAAYTFRALGHGFSGLTKFTSLMNMPKAMTHNNYDKVVENVSNVVKDVAHETMQDAANEIKREEEEITNTAVSVDGSWQKRGYSSFNGVVTAISMETGKILDVEPLTRMCVGCKAAEGYRSLPI